MQILKSAMLPVSCPACHRPINLRQDGRLRVHGPTGAHCRGSGELPLAASSVSVDPFISSLDSTATSSPDFSPISTNSKILKRIPRGARDFASESYAKKLNAALQKPDDREAWTSVFTFPSCCLRQPTDRGGRRKNLTTEIKQQISDCDEGKNIASQTSSSAKRKPHASAAVTFDSAAAKRALAKLDETDIKGAIRQICSTDSIVKPSVASYNALLAKHPPAPEDRRTFSSIDEYQSILVSTDQVLSAIKSFPQGSSGGPDGLRPQHLKDMTERQIGGSLIIALTNLVNFFLAGKAPVWLRPYFFGASLFAFAKKDGGLRPIAVGLTLRRLVAKVACRIASAQCIEYLKPRQLGVGVKGGAEALVHGARHYLDNMPENYVFVKLDFSNAFNSLRRDAMREAVAIHLPGLLGYVDCAYGQSTRLQFGEFTIDSAEGIQQGDPLGPLLFCLTIQPLLSEIQSEFVSGYLDDIAIGGEISITISDINRLEVNAKALGLALNHSKCEAIGISKLNYAAWESTGLCFGETQLADASLLGTPIHAGGIDNALAAKTSDLEVMVGRLSLLPAHAALFLLKNAFSIPKLMYILRTAPCSDSNLLMVYDNILRSALASLLNIDMSIAAWDQATLPLRWGGIGVRSAYRLAPSAFLASAAGATELLSQLLPGWVLSIPDTAVSRVENVWRGLGGDVKPCGIVSAVQRNWDEAICKVEAEKLRMGVDERTSARLLASCAPGSGAWLSAIPCASLGLSMDDSALRVAVGLRLGVPLVMPHKCLCGAHVDKFGHHGLSCQRSAGRNLRHNLLNDSILRAIQSAGIQAVREPTGLLRNDGKRPDGATLVPWTRGRCLLWDATCPDTLAQSYIPRTSIEAGAAAATSETKKITKYSLLSDRHEFVPVAIETLGSWGERGLAFINELGKRIAAVSGDNRSTAFLKQRMSLAVQRGNAAAVHGTLLAFAVDDDSTCNYM